MKLPTTSGTHKSYKPGQLITICKNVFRIVKIDLVLQIVICAIQVFMNKKTGVSIVFITYIGVILN